MKSKFSLILCAILSLALGAASQSAESQTSKRQAGLIQPGPELEAVSAANAHELPGVSLEIRLEKTRFMVGEPIVVKLLYRNEGVSPVGFTRTGTSYRPTSVVHREFRARQLDGDALLESKSYRYGAISESVEGEALRPHYVAIETLFLNERFFLDHPGRYQLTAWSNAVVVSKQSSLILGGQSNWLQSAPLEFQIVPATEAYKTQVLAEAKRQIDKVLAHERERSRGMFPPGMEDTFQVTQRLVWLHDDRAIPILVTVLEIGKYHEFEVENALHSYSRDKFRTAFRQRLAKMDLVVTSRRILLAWGADSPAEKQKLGERLDNQLRVALRDATGAQRRGALAARGLVDSPVLRHDPLFWHEALTNLAIGGRNFGADLYTLLSDPTNAKKTRVDEFPIQTADLKTAFETAPSSGIQGLIFYALETRDPLYLRQFVLARLNQLKFDYAYLGILSDAQMQGVAARLVAAIQGSDHGDGNLRDGYGRLLRDSFLGSVTIEQLEQTEGWLLQHAPYADAPILDAISLKMPSRTWFWLQQSLAKRPLESPYDNRMRALVVQEDQEARQIVRGLLQNGSEARRVEVLNAISYTADLSLVSGQAQAAEGNSGLPRATASTFDDLQDDFKALSTVPTAPPAVKEAATRASDSVLALQKRAASLG